MRYEENLNKILTALVEHRASDLFLTVGFPPALKIDGQLRPLGEQRLKAEHIMGLAGVMQEERHKLEFAEKRELNFAYETGELGRFRVNAMLQKGRPALVLRRIPTTILTLDELEMPEILKKAVSEKDGILLVVGGTGSGKSTTLAALVDYRNRNSSGHIVTIEDPVEFIHEHQRCIVHQRELGMDTESWSSALKNALRQAPDVVLIGEIRDRETMEHALAFSETGHLCLATLHANNAHKAIDRILNMFPEEMRQQILGNLSYTIRGILSQRLVPRADGDGRVCAVEVLLLTPLISGLIEKGDIGALKEAMEKGYEQGLLTVERSLFELYKEGIITEQAALHYADNANNLRLQIQQRKHEVKPLNVSGKGGLKKKIEPPTSRISLVPDEDQEKKLKLPSGF